MNEKVISVIVIIILLVVSRFCWNSSRRIESRDSELERTRTELRETVDRLRRAEERNRELESAVSDATDRLGELNEIFRENNGGLHSTIEQLQLIAEEVEALEARLRDLDSDRGDNCTSVDLCI